VFGDEAHTALAYEHNADFSRVLADRMAFYSADQRADTINRVRGEITEVKNVMIENIDKVGAAHYPSSTSVWPFFCTFSTVMPRDCYLAVVSWYYSARASVCAQVERCLQVLDRGERIELLVDKTDHLQNESFAFKREARRLKTKLWWKNIRLLAFIALIVLIIAYIIVCFVCSPTFHC
jgi:vesicle-associated membrane protein 7